MSTEPSNERKPEHLSESSSADVPPNGSTHPKPEIPDHELSRCIGHGSYGEVWLARNIMGEWRAVKVVYRDTFESEKPYEREFEGIKKFEPISRSHESQVDILHVGRNDEAGYFYYVMELADDARGDRAGSAESEGLDPEGYLPKTLHAVLRERNRLRMEECVELATGLTMALAHLHSHGLVHRDIKPSNIIFVNGRPKLADIGLVAKADATLSFVGTEGYLPPEGPGKPRADLYSLGKVFYEIATGKGRMQYPEPPTLVKDLSEHGLFLEFNEILLKACRDDVHKRYQTAEAMHQDLLLLRAGRSVRCARRWERFLNFGKKAAAILFGLFVIGAAGYLLKQDKPSAVAKVTRIHMENAGLSQTRWGPRNFDFSPDGSRLVLATSGPWSNLKDELRLWDETRGIDRRLDIRSEKGWVVRQPRWSPDGSRIMAIGWRVAGPEGRFESNQFAFVLVDPETGEVEQVGQEFGHSEEPRDFCWRPDGSGITYRDRSEKLYTLMLSSGLRAGWVDWQSHEQGSPTLGGYSPDGQWLALSVPLPLADADVGQGRDLWIVRHLGGRALRVTDTPEVSAFPTWAPDGEWLYFVESALQSAGSNIKKIRIDSAGGNVQGEPRLVWPGPSTLYLWPRFVQGRKTRLAYGEITPNNRVWIAPDGRFESGRPVAQGVNPQLSWDGQRVYYVGQRNDQRGIWTIRGDGGEEARAITKQVPDYSDFTLSPDETTIAFTACEGSDFCLFTVSTRGGSTRRLLEIEVKNRSTLPVWSPDSQWLAYADGNKIYAMRKDGSERKEIAHLWRWQGWTLKWSPRGDYIAAFGYQSAEELQQGSVSAFWVSFPEGKQGRLTPPEETKYKEGLEWHPDGDRLTYMYHGPEDYGDQIRWAYLDGHSELWFDLEDHWDWIGTWAPDGERFYFFSKAHDGKELHVRHLTTGEIEHGLGSINQEVLPRWSGNGETMAWTDKTFTEAFGIMEDFR